MEKLTNRILLIDDNPDNLELLSDLIQHAFPGYATIIANSGVKGLSLAASEDPDIVLLDVIMPGMNGFEVCQKLKSDPKTSLIPVVFVTAIRGDREARLQAIEVGADAFLSRPVDESELKAQIRAMQKIKSAAALQQDEKENLTRLVTLQTQALQETHSATLNLLDDLHAENEARKKNEAALRDSEDKFRYLFDYSVAPKSVTQLSGVMQVNQAFCDMLGYSRAELENKTWQELTHPDDVEMNQKAIDALLSGEKESIRLTKRYLHKNGSIVWVDLGSTLRRDQNGQPLYLISSFNDITERKHAEDELSAAKQELERFFELVPDLVAIASTDGYFKKVNQAWESTLGFTIAELLSQPFANFIHPDDIEPTNREVARQIGGNATINFENRYHTKDGAYKWLEWHAIPAVDGSLYAAARDITARRQAQALQQAIYQIAAAAETTISLDELYPKIHQSISSVMPAENFFIALYDGTRNLLQFPYFKDIKDAPFVGEVEPGQGLTAYVLRSGSALLCPQALRHELVRQGKVAEQGSPCAIWLGVPLIAEGKTIGVMAVQHYSDPQAYGESEQHILEFVSTQVAIAISRKQAEEALRESEQRFRSLFEKAPVGIYISRNGIGLYANQKDLQIFGLSNAEEIIGRPVTDFLAPESIEASQERTLRRALGLPTPGEIETMALRPDGSQFPAQVVVDSVQLADGPANLSFITDITERKQARALQEAVYQIATAAETSISLDELYPKIHQCISEVMPAEDFYIALYDQAQNLLRFPYFKNLRDEAFVGGIQPGRGTTAYVLRTGKSLLCTRARHAELERQGEVTLLGIPSAIWLGVPLIVEGKTIGAMVVQHYSDPQAYGEREQHMLEFVSTQVAIAISRKQAEAAVRESESRYRGLFEHSPVSLWEEDFSEVKRHIEKIRQSGVTDFRAFFESHPQELLECIGEIKVLDVNAATLALMHAANKGQLIDNLQQVFPIDTSKDFVDEFVSIAEGQIEFTWESANYTLDGQKLTISLQRSAEPGHADTLEKVLISVMDITERKQAEDQIRQLNASLEQRVAERTRQLSEAQEQLVRHEKLATLGQLAGGVGHELRNPLGVINSAVYYLKLVQPDANEKIKKYHSIIEQEVNTASRIINDLLDFGRIVSPDRQPVSIPDLVQHMLTRFPVPPSVHLQLSLPASLPKVFVDPIHLEQVLGNLTTNACQAMRECKDGGSLVISASQKNDQVAIAVKDNGTGITPEAMQRLFEPLFTTKLRGIGLGLAVSKKLAEANGGSITVRSQPGEGATFTVCLPVKA